MMVTASKIIYWFPRITGIGFVLFLSMFALDVFEQFSGWGVIPALVMHLLPSLALLAVIGIAWKYELVGAISFFLFSVGYVWMVGFDRHWSWYVAISGPAALIGVLFLVSWLQKINVWKTR